MLIFALPLFAIVVAAAVRAQLRAVLRSLPRSNADCVLF